MTLCGRLLIWRAMSGGCRSCRILFCRVCRSTFCFSWSLLISLLVLCYRQHGRWFLAWLNSQPSWMMTSYHGQSAPLDTRGALLHLCRSARVPTLLPWSRSSARHSSTGTGSHPYRNSRSPRAPVTILYAMTYTLKGLLTAVTHDFVLLRAY